MRQKDFGKYGKSFQQKVVQLILMNKQFADQIRDILKPEYLQLEYLQKIVKIFYQHNDDYGKYPSFDTLATSIRLDLEKSKNKLKDNLVSDITSFFRQAREAPRVEDDEFVKDEVVKFCKDAEMARAIVEAAELLQSNEDEGKYDEIRNMIDRALKAGAESNFGVDYLDDFEERYKPENRNALSTGWDEINKITKGGYGKGELAVYLAPTGTGKSFILAHHAITGLKNGLNVIYYTLELGANEIALRVDAGVSGIHLDELVSRKDEVIASVQKCPGKLRIKQYPPNTATIATIKAHIEKLKAINNFIPDIILIDYGDLIKGAGHDAESHRYGLQKTFENMRAIAVEYDVCVITATQTNRTGVKAELITLDMIADAFNKCFIADFIIGFSRTTSDKAENKGRIYFAKNRKGSDGLYFPAEVNWGYARINVHPKDSAKLESIEGGENRTASQKIKDKLMEFQQQMKQEKDWG